MKYRIDKTEYTFDKNSTGNNYWYKNGNYHRDKDLPAIIWYDGDMFWFENGEYHRENDKPAIIHNNGSMAWYIDGEFIKEYKK